MKIGVVGSGLVGGNGIMATFPPPLNDDEQAQLQASAAVIREAIDCLP